MRRVIRAAGLAGLVVALAAWAQAPASVTIDVALDRYAAGDASSVASLDRALTVERLTTVLDRWIAAGDPAGAAHRRRVAAAFALDAVWSATRTPHNALRANLDPWGRVTPSEPDRIRLSHFVAQGLLATWAMSLVTSDEPVDAVDHLAVLAAVAIFQDGAAWRRLHDALPAARARLPHEPRLRLAAVLAQNNMALGSLRASNRLRNDLLQDDALGSGVTRRIGGAIDRLRALQDDPSIAGEAGVHIGYLELRRRQWQAAIDSLERARAALQDPVLIATADYLTGWIHEHQERDAEAVEAYRRVVTFAPAMRNPATRLAALLFLSNERTESYRVLDTMFNARERPQDLLVALERGDARHAPDRLRALREALR